MYATFVSACEKKAIKRTRAILDSYAIRTGVTSWATPITQEALSELRAALKRSATRQTSVACYINAGRRKMRLAWIVGSRSSFGESGHFRAGTKRLSASTEHPTIIPEWVRIASMLAHASGLVHDIGKASKRFQDKLRNQGVAQSDDIRHEWISMRVLQEMRGNGHRWAEAWSAVAAKEEHDVRLGIRHLDRRNAIQSVSNILEAIDFLVVTHHGLLRAQGDKPLSVPTPSIPTPKGRHVRKWPASVDQITPQGQIADEIFQAYWKLESRLQARCSDQGCQDTLFWRAITLVSRAALIFADHVISAQRVDQQDSNSCSSTLFANTQPAGSDGQRKLNQTLDWHLQAVGDLAERSMVHFAQLGAFTSTVDLHDELPGLSAQAVENICHPSDTESRFAWQNTASDALAGYREANKKSPTLVFNMAGTGAGKTRMNLRAACVLSSSAAPRIAIALNLRSLTLQTGAAIGAAMELDANEMAVIIGDSTAQQLFEFESRTSQFADEDENGIEPEFDTDGNDFTLPAWIDPIFKSAREKSVLAAPLLVSTIDFLIAAGEPGAQGHHVKALSRLMSSDLVLDEIDSYEPEPLVSVLRLVQLAALFGRNVICSSATLAMPVALAVERAFRSGIEMRSKLTEQDQFGVALIDDHLPPAITTTGCGLALAESFESTYALRLKEISALLAARPSYRVAELLRLEGEPSADRWTDAVIRGINTLHDRHGWRLTLPGRDGVEQEKYVSFGLVRVANIGAAVQTARLIAQALPHARVACYHSGHFLLARFQIERSLDFLLSRSRGNSHIGLDAEVRASLSQSESEDIPFIVVATPVEEIGRDHDFDWGVVDVSSAQSLVQTAGRTNRHRLEIIGEHANILIPQFNFRHCSNVDRGVEKNSAFIWPGFEAKSRLNPMRPSGDYGDHDLERLLPWDAGRLQIDARLRFDTGNCALAAADDAAILKRLAPFFGETGVFCTDPINTWSITDGLCGPYFPTSLRASSGADSELRVSGSEPNLTFEQMQKIVRFGRVEQAWMEVSIGETRPALENAWLAAPPSVMNQIGDEASLDPKRGMVVTLKSYGTNPIDPKEWQYDLAFGVHRL